MTALIAACIIRLPFCRFAAVRTSTTVVASSGFVENLGAIRHGAKLNSRQAMASAVGSIPGPPDPGLPPGRPSFSSGGGPRRYRHASTVSQFVQSLAPISALGMLRGSLHGLKYAILVWLSPFTLTNYRRGRGMIRPHR